MLRYVGGHGVARMVLEHNNIGHFEYTRGGGIGGLRLRPPGHQTASASRPPNGFGSGFGFPPYVRTLRIFSLLNL